MSNLEKTIVTTTTTPKLTSIKKTGKSLQSVVVIFSIIAILLPLLFNGNTYMMTQMNAILSYAIATLGLTVALGYAGQVALSQAAFFGIGAYTLGILGGMHGWTFWEAFVFGIIIPVIAGLILGAICLRLVTHYLALATIGFGVIVYLILFNWKALTGGADGVMNIPRPTIPFLKDATVSGAFGLSGDIWFYWVGFILLLVSAYVVYKLRHSRLGRSLLAIREDELAAQTNGIDLFTSKLFAFAVSAGLGGLGGMVFAAGYMYISPTQFVFDQSVVFFAMTIVGGSFSILGTLLGTVFLGMLPELLRNFDAYFKMVYGGLIVLSMIFLPRGIWGFFLSLASRWNKEDDLTDVKVDIKFPKGGKLTFLEEREQQLTTQENKTNKKNHSNSHRRSDDVVMNVSGLKKYFGGVKAVDGVDFTINRGEIHALIGPNGSGKTTVINLLSGLYKAKEGSVTFKEKDITSHKPNRIVEYGVSRTFQNIRLFPELTVIENVMIGHHARTSSNLGTIVFGTKKSREEETRIREKAEEALRFVGFTHFQEYAKNLSYGQRRMVEIARTLTQEPELLLLDEPAAGLNPEETQELVKLLKRLNELGLTLFLIEHDMDLISDVADHITVLDFGKKICEGSVEEVLNDPEVVKAYLGEEFVNATEA